MDDELVELCRKIYWKHRDAIDLISELGSASEVLEACGDMVREKIPSHELQVRQVVWFLPKAMPPPMIPPYSCTKVIVAGAQK